MATQQYHLRWKNHSFNTLTVFEQLLLTESLVDVTLACDGLSLKAHRIVLSACSPYFHSLFLENPCQHPIVIMKDINYKELKSVIDFMYSGEVSVSHEELDGFIKTAETLKVKGISEITSGLQVGPVVCQENIARSCATTAKPYLPIKKKCNPPRKRLSVCGNSNDEEPPSRAKELRKTSPKSSVRSVVSPSSLKETCQHLVSDLDSAHSTSLPSLEVERSFTRNVEDMSQNSSVVHLGSNSESNVPLPSSSHVNFDQLHQERDMNLGSLIPLSMGRTPAKESCILPLSVGQDLSPVISNGDNSRLSVAASTPVSTTSSVKQVKVANKQQVPGAYVGRQPSSMICSYCKKTFSEAKDLKEHILQAIAASDIGHFKSLDRPK